MKFRKRVCRRNGSNAVLPSILTEVVNLILCLKPKGHSCHSLKCLARESGECEISKFEILPDEVSEGSVEEVTLKRYEYVQLENCYPMGRKRKKFPLWKRTHRQGRYLHVNTSKIFLLSGWAPVRVLQCGKSVTILYRPAVESVDGRASKEDDPQIVREYLSVIHMMMFKITIEWIKLQN